MIMWSTHYGFFLVEPWRLLYSLLFYVCSKAGPKIDASEFTVLVKASIEFPTIQRGKRK